MHFDASYEDYLRYYKNQAGFGHIHPGISTFKGPIYQRGNGLGSIFSSLFRAITPLFQSDSVKKIGKALLSTGLNVGSDVLEGKRIGQSLKQRFGETGSNLLEDAAISLRDQSGSGRRKRKRKSTKGDKSPKRRKKVKKQVKRRIKKKTKKRKSKRNKKHNIFA